MQNASAAVAVIVVAVAVAVAVAVLPPPSLSSSLPPRRNFGVIANNVSLSFPTRGKYISRYIIYAHVQGFPVPLSSFSPFFLSSEPIERFINLGHAYFYTDDYIFTCRLFPFSFFLLVLRKG